MRKKIVAIIASIAITIAVFVTPTLASFYYEDSLYNANISAKVYNIDSTTVANKDVVLVSRGEKTAWSFFASCGGDAKNVIVKVDGSTDYEIKLYVVVGEIRTLIEYNEDLAAYIDTNAILGTEKKLYIIEFIALSDNVNIKGVRIEISGGVNIDVPGNDELPVGDEEGNINRVEILENLSNIATNEYGNVRFVSHDRDVIKGEIFTIDGGKTITYPAKVILENGLLLKVVPNTKKFPDLEFADLRQFTAVVYVPSNYILKQIIVSEVQFNIDMQPLSADAIVISGVAGNVGLSGISSNTLTAERLSGVTVLDLVAVSKEILIEDVKSLTLSNITMSSAKAVATVDTVSGDLMLSNLTINGKTDIRNTNCNSITLSNITTNEISLHKVNTTYLINGNVFVKGKVKGEFVVNGVKTLLTYIKI